MDLVANHLYKQRIEPVRELEEHVAEVDADPQQLEQVLVNLYLNAIDDAQGRDIDGQSVRQPGING